VINTVLNIDCLEGMKMIPDKNIDMILCDLPYGTTACKWDVIIPFEPLWKHYERIIKDNGAIVLTASQPFTSMLVCSNLKLFKYSIVWKKTSNTGFAQAPYCFMKMHEDVVVFSSGGCSKNAKKRMVFNPQNLIYKPRLVKGIKATASEHRLRKTDQKDFISEWTNYPKSVIEISNDKEKLHPTQKPIALLEYLIKTYTNEGQTVLDNCAGSGTTAIACMNTNRNYILMEKEEKYFNIIRERIKKHCVQNKLFAA
jgi:site-specific DNA-methyltransferase (adenine-specific)